MDPLERFVEAARRRRARVVLPEGGDARVVAAARRLKDQGIAEPILLGSAEAVDQACRAAQVSASDLVRIDPATSADLGAHAAAYAARREVKESLARRMVTKPLFYGGMLVASGAAETMVAGVAHATASVIQAGALTIGLQAGLETVSSFFLMVLPEFRGEQHKCFVFADCAVAVAPTAQQLADIALASLASAGRLLTETPRVALLSFSTRGSAAHEHVDRVTQALALARQRAPEALLDGEFQLDAAIVPQVAAKKVRGESAVAGQANVLVFPDLNAGNIAYKLAQYLGGARAIGPFLQGFAKPISDLSRGASIEDIVATTAVVLAMGGAAQEAA
ncbi:MAG: phosphate acetyltransferase [Pirellulaceae bacterium]|jgi:phosphate acetyltransferase|nr:phosphate acetyltransferase [Pirellulaceae bacterium]